MHGELVTMLAVCWAGDLAAGERALRPLRSFGRPLADLVAPMPYTTLQTSSDAAYPNGQQNYWKSHYVDEITDGVIATLLEHVPLMASPQSSFYFQHLGGAISRQAIDAAAFGHRDAAFDFAILTVWQNRARRTPSTSPGRATSPPRCSPTPPASTSTTSASREPTESERLTRPQPTSGSSHSRTPMTPTTSSGLNQNVMPSRARPGG